VPDPTNLNKCHERYLTVIFVEKGEILAGSCLFLVFCLCLVDCPNLLLESYQMTCWLLVTAFTTTKTLGNVISGVSSFLLLFSFIIQ
jgi:hypothetical protein